MTILDAWADLGMPAIGDGYTDQNRNAGQMRPCAGAWREPLFMAPEGGAWNTWHKTLV